ERYRRTTVLVSAGAAALVVPAVMALQVAALPLIAIAVLSVLISIWFRRAVSRAALAEDEALTAAGAQSYLGFQIQRVNGLLSSDQHRRALMSAAEEHRIAVAAWRAVGGDISVDWALDHREEIIATARVRKDVHVLGALSSSGPMHEDDHTTDLARVVVARVAELRHLGIGGESFPLVLDDPFVEVDKTTKPALLELLGHTEGAPQLIFLTEDEDVASWARLEALTGALSIVEPQPEQTTPAPTHRSRAEHTIQL
ncbi:MAG: thiamine transport system ATP-binding protein, partial [Acidimicrobiaceae bacterium]